MTHPPRLFRIWIAAMLLVATVGIYSGCVMFQSPPAGRRVEFSHRIHLEQKIGCNDCHGRDAVTGEPGPSSPRVCTICHEKLDAERPPERRFDRVYQNGMPVGPAVTGLDDEILFDHSHHVKDDNCRACHAALMTGDFILPSHGMTKPDCMSCHRAEGASNDCATCHKVIRRTVPPDNHGDDWAYRHGMAAQDPEARCGLCHDREGGADSCVGCHSLMPPRNHTETFKRRGHGVLVGMDRETCQTCHESDFCSRCHEGTRPASHTGSFGSVRNVHCLGCHQPVSSEPSCALCHRATPSHSLAVPQPAGHVPGANCRLCHGLGAPLPHVDNGDACDSCHF